MKGLKHSLNASPARDLQLLPKRIKELMQVLLLPHEGRVLWIRRRGSPARESYGAPRETLEERLCSSSAGDLMSRSPPRESCALSSEPSPLSSSRERSLSLPLE